MTLRTLLAFAAVGTAGLLAGRWLAAPEAPAEPAHAGHAVHAGAPDAPIVWTCSMHPQVRQDGPGSCPICGMDLVPAASAGAGDVAVTLAPEAQRVASIEVAPVRRRPLEHALRTVGRIEFAEPLVAYLTARVSARIERVYADFTGTAVAQGDHLVDIWSPELLVAQQELLSAGPNAAAAREKLLQLGVTEAQVQAVLASGEPRAVLTLHAPIGGTVIEKSVREQMYVQPGDPLYVIADLSTVWMFADIFEHELPWVAVGLPVDVTLDAAPGESFSGSVAFIEPVVREATRTVRVRVNLPNPTGRLKPGMFARASIRAALGPDGRRAASPLAGKWVCPMHQDVVRDEAGTCPLCGMDLRRVEGQPGAQAAETTGAWACPMACEPPHDEPGRCGTCGMQLVRVEAPSGPQGAELLAVPASAVLDSGLRRIVWVEREPGRYEAATVQLGPRAGDSYPVLAGLAEGDRVVVHGAFLLDSQAQIEGRPSLLFPQGLLTGDAPPPAHAGHAGH